MLLQHRQWCYIQSGHVRVVRSSGLQLGCSCHHHHHEPRLASEGPFSLGFEDCRMYADSSLFVFDGVDSDSADSQHTLLQGVKRASKCEEWYLCGRMRKICFPSVRWKTTCVHLVQSSRLACKTTFAQLHGPTLSATLEQLHPCCLFAKASKQIEATASKSPLQRRKAHRLGERSMGRSIERVVASRCHANHVCS